MKYTVVSALLVVALAGSALSQASCPNGENYAPCTCPVAGTIDCSGVALSDVKAIFQRTAPVDHDVLDLKLAATDLAIPADLLGSHRIVDEIYLRCSNNPSQAITADRNAFLSSAPVLLQFEVYYCDLSQLNWSFLTGFDQMKYLAIEYLSTVNVGLWSTLPAMPSMTTLEVYNCPSGVNEWTSFPVLSTGLENFYLNSDNLEDAAAERILGWIRTSSASTLQTLDISSNKLTRIPAAVNSFTKLANLDVSLTQSPGLGALAASSTSFTAPVTTLLLESSGITSITGAFQGNFASAKVTLQDNSLTRLEASVFQSMLTQMAASTGSIDVSRNPLDCATDVCHMKWLLVDNRALLAPLGGTATCSDGTAVESIPASSLNQCP